MANFLHLVFGTLQGIHDLIGFFLAADPLLFLRSSVIFCADGLFLALYFQIHIQGPVLLRNEGIDLILSVADDPQSHRLHAAGT